ncbi:VOC family protein [Aeromicrobium sp. Leaf291]|uniref:VOC family protein n=1 Tax=Aeromicrobium sp. Leaf291 TaxID=1736325 RepID=UPI0006FAC058|nr:VOC family protein [Aeromicrobium sp. Leaf291]KQP84616.1 glyoxalase [Aeromicrobium sp. Leaf291]
MTHTHHGIDYVELPAPDLQAAKAFYGAAFGWSFTDYGPADDPAYVGIQALDGEGEVGGLDPAGTPGTSGPLVQLWSADLEATRQAVLDAGGSVVDDIFAFPGGRRFHFTDPAGNRLGVWSES